MGRKNIILGSLKEAFELIWKNKPIFFLLFAIQIILFAALFLITLNYEKKIMESAKAAGDYISKQKLDEASVTSSILSRKSILGEDPLAISRNMNAIAINFRIYLIYTFALLVFFATISWAITGRIIRKNGFMESAKCFLKIFAVLSFYLGMIFLFFYSIANIPFAELGADAAKLFAKYVPFLIVSPILLYFMFVSVSLLHRTELKNIVQKTLTLGIKKAHYILAVYLINIFLFGFSAFLLLHFIEENLFFLLLSLMLMVFSFVFGRIFMINVADKLD